MKRIGIIVSFLGLGALGYAAPRAASPASLVGEWHFSEGSGTTAADSSGSGFTGTLTNGPTWTMGRTGTGVNLSGTAYVNLGSNLSILNSASQASASLWIKPSSTIPSGSFRELVSISVGSSSATDTSRFALALQGNGTGGQVYLGGRSTDTEAEKHVATTANVTLGTWTHVAGVVDYAGNTLKIYINGTLSATASAVGFASASTPNTPSRNCALGAEDSGDANFFQGALDEVQVLKRALSATEIATLAQGDALAARWSFDEGSGTTANDSTGNGYTGTLTNGATFTSAGEIGGAVTLDGVKGYVNLGANLNVLRNVNAASVSAWVKPASVIPSGAYRELVSISVNATAPTDTSRVAVALQGDGTTGGLLFAGGRSTDTETEKHVVSGTGLPLGVWSHIAAVLDFSGKTISLFINGQPAGSAAAAFTQSHTPNTVTTNATLGAEDTGDAGWFAGSLDEVRIYARPLSECDAEALALQSGLDAWWKFDEASGTTTADSSGNGFTGTLKNGATFAAGKFGNAVKLNGTNQFVNLGTQLPILNGVRAATVTSWVNLSSQPASGAFHDLVSLSVNNGTTLTDTSRVVLSLKGNGTTSDIYAGARSLDTEAQQVAIGTASLGLSTWYHVAMVVDYGANTIKVYKNGTLLTTQAVAFGQPSTPNTNSTNAALGSQDTGDGNWFAGLMDDTRVYCRGLSDAEIQALAGAVLPAAPTNLVATAGDTKVTLTWTAASNAASYNVYERLDGGTYSTTPLANTTATTFTVTGLTNGQKYWFKVTGVSLAGEGPASAEASATPAPAGTAPPPPVIVTASQSTKNPTLPIVGTAAPNVTITVFYNGVQEAQTATSDFQGNWSLTPAAKADGTYSVTAKASNSFGTSGASNAVSILVDTTPPAITNPSPASGSTVFSATPTISATWSDGGSGLVLTTAVITLDGGSVSNPNATATGFSFTPSPLAQGTHTVIAQIQDQAGNTGSLTWSFSVLLPPPAPQITQPVNGALLVTGSPTVSGTSSSSGLTITLFVNGTANGTATSGAGGAWTLSPVTAIPDGPHTLTATAANAAGPSPQSPAISITIDTIPPVIANPSPANGATITTATPTVSASWSDAGTGVVPSTGVITLDGVTVTGATLTASGFSFTPTLAAGTHTVSAQVKDLAGNVGSLSWSFTVSLPPPAPTITSPVSGSILATGVPAISGTSSSSGLTITLFVDGAARGTTTSGTGGAWSLTPNAVITDGTHTLTATASNGAGSSPASAGVLITVDTVPPVIANPMPANGSTVTTSTPTVSATWTDGGSGVVPSTAVLTLDGVLVTGATLAPTGFSFTPTLAVGTHTVSAQVKDQAGNVGSLSWSFTVALPPPAPVISAPAPGAILATATPTVAGSSSASGLTITLLVDGVARGTTTTQTGGGWSLAPNAPIADGTHTLTATAANAAGTSTASAGIPMTIDTTPPVISNPSPANGATITTTTPTVSASWSDGGSGLVLSTAALTLDGTAVSGATLTATGFSFAPTLGAGTHTVSAQIKDAAGNTGTLTWSFTVLLVPPAPTISSPASGAILSTGAPTVSGFSSAAGLTITLLVDGVARGTTTSVTGGGFSLSPNAVIPDGTHTLTATAGNAAGTSPASTGVAITVDTVPPAITSPFPPNASTVFTATPLVSASWSDSGTGVVPSTAVLTLDGGPVTGATVTATGFSFTPTLAAGPHSVSAQVKDQAGNTGSLSWTFTALLVPTAPAITSPAAGSFLATGSPTVSGTSSASGLTITLLVDGAAQGTTTSLSGGAWSVVPTTAMGDGSHTLSATAGNAAGTSPASPGISITVDTHPPTIGSPTPAPGSTVTVATPIISASWSDATSGVNPASAVLLLDGSPLLGASVSSTGFSAGAPSLGNGIHTVSVQVSDRAGNSASLTWSFTVNVPVTDTIPPVISGVTPLNGSFVSSKRPILSASASDQGGSGLASLVLKLDGAQVAAVVTFSDSNDATATFTPTSDLTEAVHTLTVEARDGASNFTSATATFTVDATPPTILASVSPSDPLKTQKVITVIFSDAHLVASSRQILVDLADQTTNGTFSGNTWTLSTTLPVGAHSVVGQAADQAGNVGQGTVSFTISSPPAQDTKPPTVAITYPTTTFISRPAGSTLQVVVQATDNAPGDTGIATVQVLLNGVVQGTQTGAAAQAGSFYTFQITLPNAPGTTATLTAQATDVAGNQAQTAPVSIQLGNAPFGTLQAIQVQVPATANAGVPFNVVANLQDAQGNPAPVETILQVVSSLASTSVTMDTNGQSQVTIPFTINGAGIGVIEVSDFVGSGLTGTAVIQVNAGAPSQVGVQFFRTARLSPGKTLSEVNATVTDASGNPIPNQTVTWTVQFSQNGSSVGQQTLTATTDQNGVAQLPDVLVPQNSTLVNASASVPTTGGGTATGSSSSPVVPDVVFNIAFKHQAVEAGMPVSFTITAINPETGEIQTNYTGTVFVYRYNKHVHGAVTVGGQSVTDGEQFQVSFTSSDQGVVFVQDGIILTERGETVLAASTVPPNWKFLSTDQPFEFNDNTNPFSTIDIEELQDAQSTIGGFSSEIDVLSSRPWRFVGLSPSTFPLQAIAILVDKFDNPAYLEPVQFSFTVNSGTPSTYTSSTNIAGFATGYGPTDIDSSMDNTIDISASAPRYPASGQDGVPEVSTTIQILAQDKTFQAEFLTVATPTVIELGQDNQAVADPSAEEVGQTTQPTVSIPFTILLVGESDPGIAWSAATFQSGDAELDGALDIQPTAINGTIKNITPFDIMTDSNGNPIPVTYDLHFTLQGTQVNVPDDGRIPARHPDGRLNAGGNRGGDVRTIAYFGKTLNFIGSVVPSGDDHLVDSSGNKPAGVFIIDAGEVRRTMVNNPGLIPQNPSGQIAGTFRVQVMDNKLSFSSDLAIRLESTGANGSPILDPVTGAAMDGTTVDVPLQEQSAANSSDPNSTSSTSLVTLPVVAVDRTFLADDAVGGVVNQVLLTSQSSIPSDGTTPAKVRALVVFPDGTAAPGATVTLSEDSPSLPVPPTINQPPATDATGQAFGSVTSTVPGTLHLTASVSVPTLDAQHPGFSVNGVKLSLLFFDNFRTVVTVPGGQVKATLYQGMSIASGYADKTRQAMAVGVTIQVQGSGDSAPRAADSAVIAGTSPQIVFNFVPTMDVFFVPDGSSNPNPPSTDPNLLMPRHQLAILVDQGQDSSSTSQSQDPNLRIVSPDLDAWKSQFTKSGNTLTWQLSSNSPLVLGGNRIRVVTFQSGSGSGVASSAGAGPSVSSANFLAYQDSSSLLISPFVGSDPGSYQLGPSNEAFIPGSHIVAFSPTASDAAVSAVLGKYRLNPVGLLRGVNLVETFDPAGRDPDTLADLLNQEPGVLCAVKQLVLEAEIFASERVPAPYVAAGSYDPIHGGFVGAGLSQVYPYLVMDTFPAHRLGELAPTGQPSARLSIFDSGFGPFVQGATNPYLAMFSQTGRLGRMVNATSNGGFINPQAGQAAWTPSLITDLKSDVMKDNSQLTTGHGTGMSELAAGDSTQAVGGNILGTGRHLDTVNFVQISSTTNPGQSMPVLANVGGGRQLSEKAFRILGAILFESTQDPPPDVMSLSLGVETAFSNPKIANEAILVGEQILDQVSAREPGIILSISAANDRVDVINSLPAAVAPPRGTRATSADNDAGNHTLATFNTAPSTISSPLVVAVSATRVNNPTATTAQEAFADSWGGNKGSNHGPRISVSAPGTDIVQFGKDSKIAKVSGTSPAGALVGGILGEMVRLDRGLGRAQNKARKRLLIRYLEGTADYFGKNTATTQEDDNVGYGRVNQWKALLAVVNDGLPVEAARPGFIDAAIPTRDEPGTGWYGFRVQTRVRSATFAMGPANGLRPVQDQLTDYPSNPDGVAAGTPLACLGYPLGSALPNGTLTLDPQFPGIASNGYFSSRFSATRDFVAPPTGVFVATAPGESTPYYSLVLNTPLMRNNGQNGSDLNFSNFVFTISIPQAAGTVLTNDGTNNVTSGLREGKSTAFKTAVGQTGTITIQLLSLLTGAPINGSAVTVAAGPSVNITSQTALTGNGIVNPAGTLIVKFTKTAANTTPADGSITIQVANVGNSTLTETMTFQLFCLDP